MVPMNGVPEDAMVLAAGLGLRMRPLTESRPKPLLLAAGKTLLDHAFDLLAAGGVRRAVVNVHYLADQIERHIVRHPPPLAVGFSDERARLLETGGGIAAALPKLGSDPFLALNADNLWEGGAPVATLAAAFDAARMDALLLLVPRARANGHRGRGDFELQPSGELRRRPADGDGSFVYTGLQMLTKRLFDGVPVEPFSMNRLWDRAAASGRLHGALYAGRWFDAGTAAALREAEHSLGRR